MVINFIGFAKAFDSIFRQSLWDILRQYGVLEKMIRLLKALYSGFEYVVTHKGKTSSYFLF